MEAKVFDLDAMRAKQRTRARMEKRWCAQMALDGWALTRSATSFWGQYATAMMLFHARLMRGAFSLWSRPPGIAEELWS